MEIKYKQENKVSKEEQGFRNTEAEKVDGNIDTAPYTDEEIAYRGELMKKILLAQENRNAQYTEWNDMDFYNNYISNKKAANSYNEPKKNQQDTRIVTGTTEEKGVTLLSALLNYNLEPNVEAYDKQDLPVMELGEVMEDMVKKSRKMEEYDDKRPLIYKELLDQGSCFVEVIWTEKYKTLKKLAENWDKDGSMDIEKIKWDTSVERYKCGIETRLVEGLKVFLGNMKEFEVAEQPYIFTIERMSYE